MLTDALIRGRQTTRGVNSYLSGGTIRKLMGGGAGEVQKKYSSKGSVLFSPFPPPPKKKRLIAGQANLDLSDVANLG